MSVPERPSPRPDDDALPNPFSTRFVRPGAIPYLFPPDESPETLVERFRQSGWEGAIVGPHGSGKSTLLAALAPALERAGRLTRLITLHDGQRRLPVDWTTTDLDRGTVVMVDGYEQLSAWSKASLRRTCRRRGFGLLVTTHAATALPTLFTTAPSAELARRLVAHLLPGATPIAVEEVDEAFARCRGDLRETLFALYDLYETHRASAE